MSNIRQTRWGPAFHVPDGAYLLSHSVGCMPVGAREAVASSLLDPWAQAGGDAWPAWLGAIARFREALAGLLGGRAADYCPQPGVSAATFRLLSALPRSDRDVLLISRHAFASVAYALTGLEKLGFTTRLLDGDPTDLATWDAAMTRDVAAAVFMHVHSNSGLVSPIADLAALARSRGIFTIADMCQSAGIVPIDVAALGSDAIVGSCVKWLCGGPGAGYLWVRPDRLAELEPPDRGWFSHEDPFAFRIDDFRYAGDAARFWGGTPSVAPYVLATQGIEAIRSIGVTEALAHNRALIRALLQTLPAQIAERIDLAHIGGTLCLDFGAQAERNEATLKIAGCRLDRRGTTLRLSFHVFNAESDVSIVAGALDRLGGA